MAMLNNQMVVTKGFFRIYHPPGMLLLRVHGDIPSSSSTSQASSPQARRSRIARADTVSVELAANLENDIQNGGVASDWSSNMAGKPPIKMEVFMVFL